MDVNKVSLCGSVHTDPLSTKVGEDSTIVSFLLDVKEFFHDKKGNRKVKTNRICIECLGRTAQSALKKVQKGRRIWIDGYIRSDYYRKERDVRVRAYAVQEDISNTSSIHKDGIRSALDIVKGCYTKEAAEKRLEELLKREASD